MAGLLPRRSERLLAEHSGRQLILLTDETGARGLARRYHRAASPGLEVEARQRALAAVLGRPLPGLAEVYEAHYNAQLFEVVEAFVDGPTLSDVVQPVQEALPLLVALDMGRTLAQGLATLHALRPAGGGMPLVHGRIGLDRLVLSHTGELFLVGLTGLQGHPQEDVTALISCLHTLIARRAEGPKGETLLRRLGRLREQPAQVLADQLGAFLGRADPERITRKRMDLLRQLGAGGQQSGPPRPPPTVPPQAPKSVPPRPPPSVPPRPPPNIPSPQAAPPAVPRPVNANTPLERPAPVRPPVQGGAQSVLQPTAPDALMAGTYRVLGSIGRGGMGEVYLARDLRPGHRKQLVALKVLGTGHDDEDYSDALGMLMDEASIMAQIEHPNVLRVLDFQHAQGRHFLATEYLEGRALVRVMIDAYERADGLSYPVICAIGAQSARGLHAAHTAVSADGAPLAVVHRDVSPQNIFVTYDGTVKVLDFGVARATERVSRTRAGLVKGKAAYMSPEQAEGRDLDARSDVFSLGICLWEMTAGRRLFKRESEYETLLAVQTAEVQSPTTVRGNPDPELDGIILRTLERSDTRRTPSAAQLAEELTAYAGRHGVADLRAASSELVCALFGEVAERERSLILRLEDEVGGGTELGEALASMSSADPTSEITVAAEPSGLLELDRFGTPGAPRGMSKARVFRGLEEAKAAREAHMNAELRSLSGQTLLREDTPNERARDELPTEVYKMEKRGGLWVWALAGAILVAVGGVLVYSFFG